jgi:hypothetical protein
MKFRLQFEFHKIPEWHQEYIDYLRLKLLANNFDQHVKSKIYFFNFWFKDGDLQKLSGFYTLTVKKKILHIDLGAAERR